MNFIALMLLSVPYSICQNIPIVVNTWAFNHATEAAWESLTSGSNTVEAIVDGCSSCELNYHSCDTSVGYGGSPDENGETTLDAMVMDGVTHDVGSVAGLRQVKNAIGVAHAVMKYTTHTLLVGSEATAFAQEMGFNLENLTSEWSAQRWQNWKANNCQPNYRQNVSPDPDDSCGPYTPDDEEDSTLKFKPRGIQHTQGTRSKRSVRYNADITTENHDTIGMVIVDENGNLAAGTSTNGAGHKVPGRVGDSPITGAGAYVDNDVGGAAATGDGDVMMRFLPSFKTVELMRQGRTPSQAAGEALDEIKRFYPNFAGAIVAVDKQGNHGGSCRGFNWFKYALRTGDMEEVEDIDVPCT